MEPYRASVVFDLSGVYCTPERCTIYPCISFCFKLYNAVSCRVIQCLLLYNTISILSRHYTIQYQCYHAIIQYNINGIMPLYNTISMLPCHYTIQYQCYHAIIQYNINLMSFHLMPAELCSVRVAEPDHVRAVSQDPSWMIMSCHTMDHVTMSRWTMDHVMPYGMRHRTGLLCWLVMSQLCCIINSIILSTALS